MERQDFWYTPKAEEKGAIPTGCKAGQLLFLSAQTPIDLETGAAVRTLWDLPPEGRKQTVTGYEFLDTRLGPVKAQTWAIYTNLAKILAQQGSSLDNVVRQRIFLRDLNDTAAMEEVMLRFFPREKPATLIQGVPCDGLEEGLHIQVEVIALVPQPGGLSKEALTVPELAAVTAPYPSAVKVGQFLFTSGLIGMDPTTGRVVSSLAELGGDAKEVATQRTHTDATGETAKAQWWLIFRHLRRILESQGAPLTNTLRVHFYLRRRWTDNAEIHPLRSKLFKRREDMPALTGFWIQNLHIRSEVQVLIDAVGLLPGPYRKEVGTHPERGVSYINMWTKARPFWFVSGELPVDPTKHQVIRSFADLGEDGQWLAQGRFHDGQMTMAQAWFIYRQLERLMKTAGTGLPRVVQQYIFLQDMSQYPAVERVASMVYNGRIPPTTAIPVDGIGPFDEDMLEIETISLAD